MKLVSKILAFFVIPGSVLFAHLIASQILDLYSIFPPLDIPFHYLGGLSIAYTSARSLNWLEEDGISPAPHKTIFLLLVFALTATAAVLWEFMEFSIDRILNTNIQISLTNTMQDQFMGILGRATCVFFYFKKFERLTENTAPV